MRRLILAAHTVRSCVTRVVRNVVDGVFGWAVRWIFVEESFKFKLWSINHFAASHKILLWRCDSIFEPWPLPYRDIEAVEFLRVEDISRTPGPQEGKGISPCPKWVAVPAATLPSAWLCRSLVHEGPLAQLNQPATRWLERASHNQFHNRSTVWYTVFRIHEQKDFASQNKNVYFKLYLIFTTSCCCCSGNKKKKPPPTTITTTTTTATYIIIKTLCATLYLIVKNNHLRLFRLSLQSGLLWLLICVVKLFDELFKETPTDQTAGNDSCTPRYTGW